MPRFPRFEPTIGESLTISISTLKRWGHLKPDVLILNGSFSWSRGGEKIASVTYHLQPVNADLKCLTLVYRHGETPVRYSLDVVAAPTNLGGGKRWFFICPKTGKRCLKLICPNGSHYFFHRTAFGLLYECQKKSKGDRVYKNTFDYLFKLEDLQEKLGSKHRKSHYQGKPTPLMQQVLKWRKKTERQTKTFWQISRKG
ncbi:MAG: hypothetical protein AAB316_01445 [Bacteroidota bacterium]